MGKRYSPEQIIRKLRDAEAKLAGGQQFRRLPEIPASARLLTIAGGIATVG